MYISKISPTQLLIKFLFTVKSKKKKKKAEPITTRRRRSFRVDLADHVTQVQDEETP